ncbi:retinoic acid receptor RXR-alpha [Trichonephila clavipes]|uniref:Retinoic acid receptor RXR-alpha n=1 Tax=Trichonephila clavipes TaxID=2585209 RepID=A0A8X6RLE5_TRICX|nr:retinoic acid receptor RXR-alpha [Trichonephila clavipes]
MLKTKTKAKKRLKRQPSTTQKKTEGSKWFTCRNCGGGDRGRVAIYRPFGEVSLSLNRTVTCMMLKANDRRTSCPCHDEFRGPRSDYVRQWFVKQECPVSPQKDSVINICQAADRQLYQLVEWAKHIPHFTELPLEDQMVLLKAGWNELLIAAFSHRSVAVKDGIVLATGLVVHRNSAHSAGVGTIFERVLCELVAKMREMKMDKTELGCLRAIVLFNPGCFKLKHPTAMPCSITRKFLDIAIVIENLKPWDISTEKIVHINSNFEASDKNSNNSGESNYFIQR